MRHSEGLWRDAHAIVAACPDLEVGDVYHALRSLELTRRSASTADSHVSDVVLTPAERALLEALHALGIRFVIVGMGAAVIEGAPATTQDLDLWFGRIDAARLQEAARRAGGFDTAGMGVQPPAVGGAGLDRIETDRT